MPAGGCYDTSGRDAGAELEHLAWAGLYLSSSETTGGLGQRGGPGAAGRACRAGRAGSGVPDRACAPAWGARPLIYLAAKSSRTTTVGSRTWKVKDSRKNSATFSVSWEA